MSQTREIDKDFDGNEEKRREESDVQLEQEEKILEKVPQEGNASTPEETATRGPCEENRVEIDMGLHDNGKTINDDSKVQQQEEEEEEKIKEKARQVSPDVNTLSSTTTEIVKPSGESEFSDSSKLGNQELKERIFLFEVELTSSDVDYSWLFIPAEEAATHFPPPIPGEFYKKKIQIFDTQGEDWMMKLIYSFQEHAFIVTRRWQELVQWHNLKSKDVIRFYKPVPRLHNMHYLVECVKTKDSPETNAPEFKEENFLFEMKLTPCDVTFGRLIVPTEEVTKHFPEIKIISTVHKLERLKFTDAWNKNWRVKIIYSTHFGAYMILSGWEGFVKEHKLEAMDVIKFYKPAQPSHKRHFLVDYVSRDAAKGTNQTQMGYMGSKRSTGIEERSKEKENSESRDGDLETVSGRKGLSLDDSVATA